MYLECLVEELSAAVALRNLLPRMINVPFHIRSFRGKQDMLDNLPRLLRGYAKTYAPNEIQILVIVDADNDDCHILKARLDHMANAAGLSTNAAPVHEAIHVLNRLAIEELEAWFFGDMEAIRVAYPRVPANLAQKRPYRHPDAIRGAWETLERVLQRAGYYRGGLAKIQVARDISQHMQPACNRSPSFQALCRGIENLRKWQQASH